MRTGSFLMLLLAVIFGSGAVFVTRLWLDSQQGSLVTNAEANLPPTTTIVVARTSLRFGDKLSRDNLLEIDWPNNRIPNGAFATREDLLKDGDRYVVTAMETNETVLGWKITGPGQRATLSAVVDEGKKAVTIRVNDVLGVAGFVLPGDRVDILLTRDNFVDVLLQGVKVLAIDQLADERSDDPRVVRAVTLEVDTVQAQKLTLAATVGQLSLILRNVSQGSEEVTQRVTATDLGAGTESALPEPEEVADDELAEDEAPDPLVIYPDSRPSPYATVGVIRGTERSEYQVRRYPYVQPWD